MVVQVEEAQKGCDEEVGQELIPAEQMEDCSKEMTLSVHALKGSQGADTIKVLGTYRNRQLVILVDSGDSR